ncbi:MAG: DNA-(apurinic or apyrimidinic site) lyase [Saprospiraceae bacterium]|nr:DNA-(apurinic or apyrimidinic site) lyase [Saprospiraceae bacterium]
MPELPEVNTVRKGFERIGLSQRIVSVQVHDDKILRNCSAEAFCKGLEGHTFRGTYRRGKYFFADLDSGASVLFHLGMTGDILYYSDEAERSKHERFCIALEDGMYIGFDDPRKFARILLLQDREAYVKEVGLGPDALTIDKSAFRAAFKGRSATAKAILLNQSLMAGIGNLYADEICYQARIHPASRAGALSTRQLNKMHQKTLDILQLAVDQDAYYKIYPDDWFWKWRDLDARPPGGKGKIMRDKVAGRTTYWIEGVQKLVK